MDRISVCLLAGMAVVLTCSPAVAKDTGASQNDPRRHFFFHRPAIDRDSALKDLTHCATQAREVLSLNDLISNNTGLLGGAMASKDRRDMRAAIMRRCMSLYGYARYPLSKAEWEAIVDEGDIAVAKDGSLNGSALARFSEMAVGPAPQAARMDP